jgi:hypothetical protein
MFMLYDKSKLLRPRMARCAVFSLLILAAGCSQDSIFDYISGETAPTTARIKGFPSRIVSATSGGTEKLYVASGRVWEYDTAAAAWTRDDGLEGFVVDVAATSGGASGSVLYALTYNTSSRAWKKDGSGNWGEVFPPAGSGVLQNIFGAGDILFAGAKSGNSYAILYYTYTQTDAAFKVLREDTTLLSGAGRVGSDYYLATRADGIYKASGFGGTDAPAVEEASANIAIPSVIAGFLQAQTTGGDDIIIGISKDGHIVYGDSSGLTVHDTSLGGTYVSPPALTDDPGSDKDQDKLLLLGYQGSGLSDHGYMELLFDIDTGKATGGRRSPGEDGGRTSIEKSGQYETSLRRYPVTSLRVLPLKSGELYPVIFAATTIQGLWSYKERDGVWQWNFEE